jgi:hypothetical protein
MQGMSLPSGAAAHFHGDFSGDVIFSHLDQDSDYEVKIPFADLEKLVLEKYRREAVSVLEQMDLAQLRSFFGKVYNG